MCKIANVTLYGSYNTDRAGVQYPLGYYFAPQFPQFTQFVKEVKAVQVIDENGKSRFFLNPLEISIGDIDYSGDY